MNEISKHRFSVHNDSLKIFAIAVFYILAHQLSFFFPDSSKVIMLIWPAGGVALAAFLLSPRRLWPALIIIFLISGIGADVFLGGRSFLLGAGFMIARIVESVGCAFIILYFSKDFQNFTRVREVLTLVGGAMLVNAISSCIAAVVSVLVIGVSFGKSWQSWYISDGLAMLLIAPLIVVWISNAKNFIASLSFNKIIEGILCLIIGFLISWIIFFPISLRLVLEPHPYLLVPFLAWPAIRFGQRGVTITLISTFLIAINSSSILDGPSPWGPVSNTDDFSSRLLDLQVFLILLSVTGYLMAAGYESLKRAEKFLKESIEQLKNNSRDLTNAQSVAKIGSWKWYIQENRLEWSQGMYSIFGISENSFKGNLSEVIQQSIHPDDKARVDASNSSVSEKGIPIPLDYRIILPNGTIKVVWAEAGELIKDENSKPIVLTGFVQDITERKELENKILHSHSLMQYIIEHNRSAIAVHDRKLRYIYVSKRYLTDYNVKESDIIGKHHYEVFPDLPQKWRDVHQRALAGEISSAEDDNYIKDDGSVIWTRWECRPWYEADGFIGGFIIYTEVITKQKESEIELIKAKERAEESDRLKSAFLSNMSHEIRTPMNGILGFAELLKEPDLTGEEQIKYIEIIEKSGARLLNTINNIVDMSKIESGMMQVIKKESNINEQIQFAYNFFKPEAESKGLELFFQNGLPEEEAIIITDPEKVFAVLINLIKNAIKYTDNGSIMFGYNIVDTQDLAYLQFFVEDSGIGIPKDRQEAIFDRFIQADIEDTRAFQGSGLGLSISRSYVDMLGGRMWVESKEGKGSIFYFTIPYNPVLEETAKIKNVFIQKNSESRTNKLKILIAEDDETSRTLLGKKMEKISKEIKYAKTGIEAVEASRNSRDIDLILMDIKMPEMDGLEATRQIRQFNKEVIIIAQTSYGFSSDREKAIEAGCNDYISKPINYKILHEYVQMLFDDRS